MKTRIAIIAAFVGTFAFAQVGLAQAAEITSAQNHKPPPGEVVAPGGAKPATPTFTFSKIDSVNTPHACAAKGGTVEQQNGQPMCKTKDDNNTAMQGVSTTR
jgi:hypothetical protein